MELMKENLIVGVLDFDDVVVRGSEDLKDQAWVDIFPETEHLEIQRRWQSHFANGEGNRFDILRATLKEIYGEDSGVEQIVLEKATAFDVCVQQGILKIGLTKDDREALGWLQERYKLFLNSATPQKAIEESVEKLGIKDLFTGVFGHSSQTSKIDNLKKAASLSNTQPRQMFFIGDSGGDLNAAESFGCHFIGFATKRNGWKENRSDLLLIENLAELPALFKTQHL